MVKAGRIALGFVKRIDWTQEMTLSMKKARKAAANCILTDQFQG
jgi:hypothetical protein